MNAKNPIDTLVHDARGATIVEFALILMPLLMLLMGSLELGYRIYAQSILTGSLRDAARMASTGAFTSAEIDTYITETLHNFRESASVSIDKRSYSDFTKVGMPEPITSGSIISGKYCYDDVNKNSNYDSDQGTSGLGSAEDIIYYKVNFSYKTLFPLTIKELGLSYTTNISANTIVSNEPFTFSEKEIPLNRCVG